MPEESSPQSGRFYWLAAALLVSLGTACSAYLLAQHLAVIGSDSAVFTICRAVFGRGCEDAITSRLAIQFGIPLAGWGLVHFAVVTVALILALSLGETFRGVGILAAVTLCVVATGIGVCLTGVLLVDRTVCPLCLVVHAVNLLLVPVVLLASGRTLAELRQSVRAGIQYVRGTDDQDAMLSRWKIAGLVIVALVGIVVYQWVLIQADRRAEANASKKSFDQVLSEFRTQPPQDIPVSAEDPRLGDERGSLELVVFSDFQCPACRRFARLVAGARERHPDLIVIFKHYPLSKICNPNLRGNLHPLSCGAAFAAEAAHRQGKFWEYHDALFASREPLEVNVLRQLAQTVDIDLARFDADLADAATTAKIAADVTLGQKLKIVGTPSAFLGRRQLSDKAMAQIEALIERELADGKH